MFNQARRLSIELFMPLLIGTGFILIINALLAMPLAELTRIDHIISKSYWEDDTARKDFDDARQQDYTPFRGALSRGNSPSAIWLKLQVRCTDCKDLVLQVQPAFVQDIQIYSRDAAGQWQWQQGGNRFDFKDRALPYLNFSAPVYLPPSGAAEYYVRIRSDSAISLVRALPTLQAGEFNTLIHFILGTYGGVAFMMFMISLMGFLVTRDALWGWTALVEFTATLTTLIQTGMISAYFLPDNGQVANQLVNAGNCFFTFLFIYFIQRVLTLFSMPAYCVRPYFWGLTAFPVQCVLLLLDKPAMALAINNLLIFVISIWGFLVAPKGNHPDLLMRLTFRISLLGLTSYMIYWVYPFVLRQPIESFASLYPAMPINMFSLIMLTLIMVRHTQLKIQNQLALEQQQRETALQLESSQMRQAETEGFLGMIMHEVKSPLSFIRTAASNLEMDLAHDPVMVRRAKAIKLSVDNIDNVLERSLDIDALERGAIQPLRQPQDVSQLVAGFCAEHAHADRFRLKRPESLMAAVDGDILALILRNLLNNAVKYSPAGSNIDVDLNSDANMLRLAVTNVSSHGLPDAGQMFTKYYRSPRAMSVSGMGLGLYWVSTVVKMMNGSIQYAPHQDSVRFTLCLPR